MIKQVVEAVFGSRQDREVKRLQPVLATVREQRGARLAGLDDEAIRGQTTKFRGIIARPHECVAGGSRALARRTRAWFGADPVARESDRSRAAVRRACLEAGTRQHAGRPACPRAFATVREACRRLVGTTVDVTGQQITWNMVPYDVRARSAALPLHIGAASPKWPPAKAKPSSPPCRST